MCGYFVFLCCLDLVCSNLTFLCVFSVQCAETSSVKGFSASFFVHTHIHTPTHTHTHTHVHTLNNHSLSQPQGLEELPYIYIHLQYFLLPLIFFLCTSILSFVTSCSVMSEMFQQLEGIICMLLTLYVFPRLDRSC